MSDRHDIYMHRTRIVMRQAEIREGIMAIVSLVVAAAVAVAVVVAIG